MAKTRKHRAKKQHGQGFFDTIAKGVKFVKDNGLISKGLSAASSVANALGKNDFGDKLSGYSATAKSMGAGRKQRRKPKTCYKKFTLKTPTMRAEREDWDGNNKLAGTGKRKPTMHGKGWMDFIGPIVKGVSSLLGGARPHTGHGLSLAGGSLKLAGSGPSHYSMNPHLQNNSGEVPYHMGHNMSISRRNDNHLRGSGVLGRVNRGHAQNCLAY